MKDRQIIERLSAASKQPTKPAGADRRKAQRFEMTLPLRVVKLSNRKVAIETQTRNLSSAGAYFELPDNNPDEGSPIEFFVTMQDASDAGPIQLRCRGRVVRVESRPEGEGVGVGASIDRYQFVRS